MAKIATFSFDDGGAGDADVIRLLDYEGVPGTFYLCSGHLVPSFYEGAHRDDIRALYRNHEVGNHGRTHVKADKITLNGEMYDEVYKAEGELQRFFDQPVKCYAYPGGSVTGMARKVLEKTDVEFARSCKRKEPADVQSFPDRLAVPVTCVVRRHEDIAPVKEAISSGLPIHIVSHGWEIRVKDMLGLFSLTIAELKDSGYEFRDNYSFFQETKG